MVKIINKSKLLTVVLLKLLQSLLQSWHTILQSHQQCTKVKFLPNPCQHILYIFLNFRQPIGVKWYLAVALTCIFPMMNDVEITYTCIIEL